MEKVSKDHLERCLNSVATQSFRDQADRDYILARLACRYELYPQFLWASLQAVEKYLKAILLYNRIQASNINHDIHKALELTKRLNFNIELSPSSKEFIRYLSEYGEYRYLDVPYFVNGYLLIDLDLTVWELRRYCQVINCYVSDRSVEENEQLKKGMDGLEKSTSKPRYKFKLPNGHLENIIADRAHPSRPALLWQNAVFGSRGRKTVRVKKYVGFQNPILYLFPELLDYLKNYIKIPRHLEERYRQHLINKKQTQPK